MSTTLTEIGSIAADLKLAIATLPSTPAPGSEAPRDALAEVVPTYKMPKRPSDRKQASALFWDEQDLKASNGDGISKPVRKSGNDNEAGDNKAPACYVDEDGFKISYDEYRAARQSVRDVATSIEQLRPGTLIKEFMANGDVVKVQFQNRIYPKHPWLALCAGNYKLYKLCSSVFSDHIGRMRKKIASAKEDTPSTVPVKRESSLEEDIKLANIKKRKTPPKSSASASGTSIASLLLLSSLTPVLLKPTPPKLRALLRPQSLRRTL